jgi:hypothetical protein
MNKQSMIYLAIAVVAGALLAFYLANLEESPVGGGQAPARVDAGTDAPAPPRAEVPAPAAEVAAPEPGAIEFSEEKPILGQFMRVREIREDSGDGQLRNLEFVFREGILPQKLFPDNRQVILKYDQLARNMVGFGAATAFFYYEIVTHDTNGDGLYSDLDDITVAVSRPTGWEYRVLVSGVEDVLAYEDLPEDEALRLSVRMRGGELTRVYPLAGKP